MKKLITLAVIVAAMSVSTQANAVTKWSYNPSSFSPIRVLSQWAIGNQRIAQSTHDFCQNSQKIFALTEVWLNHYTGEITVNVITAPTGQACQQ